MNNLENGLGVSIMDNHESNVKLYFLRGKDDFFKGNYQNCIRDLIYAQEMFTTMGKTKEAAESLFMLGEAYFQLQQFSQAKGMFSQAFTSYKKINNLRRVGECALSLGEIYRNQGEFKLSKQYLSESIEIFKKLKDLEKIADTWRELANTYQISLDAGSSQSMHIVNAFKNAITIYKKLKKEAKKAETELDLGYVLISQSKSEEALKYLTSAHEYYRKRKDEENVITLLILIGRIYFETGKKSKAKDYMNKAITHMKNADYSSEKIKRLTDTIISMFQ